MNKKYTPVSYDCWNGPDGWTVNDVYNHEDITLNLDKLSSRQVWVAFAHAAGFKPRLRAVEIDWLDSDFIEFTYTARGQYFPIGRLQLSMYQDD